MDKWQDADASLKEIQVISNKNNDPVTVKGDSDKLQCIGVGTDGAVFRFSDTPSLAFKVYAENKFDKKNNEVQVYKKLGRSQFFPIFYAEGDNYIVLSYEKGITLYECLLKGIHIPKQVILDVEHARNFAKQQGLNPRDIHLKNILMCNGRAKILDVSEYLKKGDDFRWSHLKRGYQEYYHLIDRKAVPLWVMETVRKWYNQSNKTNFQYQEFVQKIVKLFKISS